LNHTSPSALAPGKTTTVTFLGEHLEGAVALWTSFPSKVTPAAPGKTNDPGPGKVALQVSVPDNAPVGIGAVQLATTNGVSDFHLFMIDDLPGVARSATNRAFASAQELKLPVAVEGNCEEAGFDYYAFKAKKGQRVSVEVVANRLGSPLDPVVRLLDAVGKELVYCDDDPAVGSDARLSFTAPSTGRYVIELRDIGYQGGPKYRYRLRVGNFPLAGATFPLGAQRGTRTKVAFIGRAVEGLRPMDALLPENATRVLLNAKFRRDQGCGFCALVAGQFPELMEVEPNDTPEAATKIPIPSVANGRFARTKDRDWYEFSAARDQRLIFSGRTRSLGSPCDLLMRLFDGNGKQLAEADISGANEGTLTNKFSEAGTYRLLVEELSHQGGPDLAYRIEVESFRPGFTLSLETNRVEAMNNGGFEIKVTAARGEYDGPITLSLDGLDNDYVLGNNIIAEKKNETTLKVTIPARVEPGQWFHFTIAGKAQVNESNFETTAGTMPALRKLFPLLRYPPVELDGLIALGIKASAPKADKTSERE
jgi:hypothetical protein